LTRRGRLTLLLGVVLYGVAWLVGSRTLYPVAVGLAGSALGAAVWVRLAARPERLTRRTTGERQLEGDDVRVELVADLRRGLPPAALVARERVGRLGEHRATLTRDGRRAWGHFMLPSVRRGRYRFEDSAVVLEDPFGLARTEHPLAPGGALLVHPRLVELDALFAETGPRGDQGRRLLLRRPAGYELHGVRDYQEGESLRRVHWPSTAKRGHLMVKDLEDAPRDELAIVLDAQAGTASPDMFDVQVRAAGSVLQLYARRSRRALLAINGRVPEYHRVASAGDWHAAYDALAGAEPTGGSPLAALLVAEAGPVARAVELVAVTATVTPALVDRLCQRAAAGRRTSLVLVEGRSDERVRPELLRLGAAGVAVAVVRRGDDLARALGAPERRSAAHA
jgi:uncharacterized protein (DUF58 family)